MINVWFVLLFLSSALSPTLALFGWRVSLIFSILRRSPSSWPVSLLTPLWFHSTRRFIAFCWPSPFTFCPSWIFVVFSVPFVSFFYPFDFRFPWALPVSHKGSFLFATGSRPITRNIFSKALSPVFFTICFGDAVVVLLSRFLARLVVLSWVPKFFSAHVYPSSAVGLYQRLLADLAPAAVLDICRSHILLASLLILFPPFFSSFPVLLAHLQFPFRSPEWKVFD